LIFYQRVNAVFLDVFAISEARFIAEWLQG